jgi:hypothetical protein
MPTITETETPVAMAVALCSGMVGMKGRQCSGFFFSLAP